MFLRLWCVVIPCFSAAALAPAADQVPATRLATEPAADAMVLPAMHFDNTPPREAFERLAREAGVTLAVDSVSPAAFWARHAEPVSIDFSPLPYWLALHEMCVATKVGARGSTAGKILLQEPTPFGTCQFADVHGLVQIELESMRDTRQLMISNSRVSTGDCRFSVRVAAAPGLHALRNDPIKFSAFTDQDGKSIEGLRQFPGFWRDGKALLDLAFHRESGVRKIAKLAGELEIVLQGEPHLLEIDNIRTCGRVERTISGIHFDIMPRYAPGTLDVEITVSQQGDIVVWDDARKDLNMTTPELFDAKGREYLAGSSSNGVGPELHRTLHYRQSPLLSSAAGEPQKLVWKFSTSGRTVKIPFEFNDIPLRMQ